MLVLNVVLSLLGWTAAFPRRSPPNLAALVVLHALASGCTLLNSSAVIERGGDNAACGASRHAHRAAKGGEAAAAGRSAGDECCIGHL